MFTVKRVDFIELAVGFEEISALLFERTLQHAVVQRVNARNRRNGGVPIAVAIYGR